MLDWFEAWSGLRLAAPGWLWIGVAALVLAWWRYRQGRADVVFAPFALLASVTTQPTWLVRLAWLPSALQWCGLVLALVAMSRPVQSERLPPQFKGIDIVLCLDCSSSMASLDLDPRRDRLALAVDAASQFIAARPGDRIALLSFGRFCDLVCPLTLDHRALRAALSSLQVIAADTAEDQTGIGAAVARAAQVLSASKAPSKVVILLSDGAENVAAAGDPDTLGPRQAAYLARQLGIRTYVIHVGVGSRSADGQWVAIDTRAVERLAKATDGQFFAARDSNALPSIYSAIDSLEAVELAPPSYRDIQWFWPFLLTAVLLMLCGRVLQVTLWAAVP